eukprot:758575-Hanusia_phi.AAC.1
MAPPFLAPLPAPPPHPAINNPCTLPSSRRLDPPLNLMHNDCFTFQLYLVPLPLYTKSTLPLYTTASSLVSYQNEGFLQLPFQEIHRPPARSIHNSCREGMDGLI